MRGIGALLLLCCGVPLLAAARCGPQPQPALTVPRASIQADELAVIVNDLDPRSVAVGAVYAAARAIPERNVVHVEIDPAELGPQGRSLGVAGFDALMAEMAARIDPGVQAFALSWTHPYRVNDCMSITAAFAVGGYDDDYCWLGMPYQPCNLLTTRSPYYDSDSVRPYTDHGIRPTMMLAGESLEAVQSLIATGVASDRSFPDGTAYLVRTTDGLRSGPRSDDFALAESVWNVAPASLDVAYIDNGGSGSDPADDHLRDAEDVLAYMTGLTAVADPETNRWLPGAVADHLTSFGGRLEGGSQMSILRWLEAGATASYGTVVEPCAAAPKFPRASVLLEHYVAGNTLIEAYWKSVERFGEGVFVGEPLARPFGTRTHVLYGSLLIETTALRPGRRYELRGRGRDGGGWVTVIEEVAYTTPRRLLVAPWPLHDEYELRELPD